MAYATVADVEVRYGRALTASESGQVEAWIERLEDMIVSRIPTLEALILLGRPTLVALKNVICEAVIRRLNNPRMGLCPVSSSLSTLRSPTFLHLLSEQSSQAAEGSVRGFCSRRFRIR